MTRASPRITPEMVADLVRTGVAWCCYLHPDLDCPSECFLLLNLHECIHDLTEVELEQRRGAGTEA